MPAATRRSTRGAPPKGAQSTLSFGNRSRVTKNTAPTGKDAKKAEAGAVKAEKPEVIDIEDGDDVDVKGQEGKAEPAKSKQTTELDTLTPVEKEAEKIPQSQITKYWQAREKERMAPRVHQEDLSTEEKILRLFDMSSQYGPCIGVTRRKRWLRAHKFGLAPPIEVLAVLVKEDKKGTKGIERSHMEELLATRAVEVADRS